MEYNLMDFLIEKDMIELLFKEELDAYREARYRKTHTYNVIEVKGYNDETLYMVFKNDGDVPFKDGTDLTKCMIEEKNEEKIMKRFFQAPAYATFEGVFRLRKEPLPEEFFGTTEFGNEIGWQKGKVSVYVSRGLLPKPVTYVGGRPAWTRRQIEIIKETFKP